MVGVGLAFLMELLDRTVKDDKICNGNVRFYGIRYRSANVTKRVAATIQKKPSAPFIKKPQGDKSAESRRSRTKV